MKIGAIIVHHNKRRSAQQNKRDQFVKSRSFGIHQNDALNYPKKLEVLLTQ